MSPPKIKGEVSAGTIRTRRYRERQKELREEHITLRPQVEELKKDNSRLYEENSALKKENDRTVAELRYWKKVALKLKAENMKYGGDSPPTLPTELDQVVYGTRPTLERKSADFDLPLYWLDSGEEDVRSSPDAQSPVADVVESDEEPIKCQEGDVFSEFFETTDMCSAVLSEQPMPFDETPPPPPRHQYNTRGRKRGTQEDPFPNPAKKGNIAHNLMRNVDQNGVPIAYDCSQDAGQNKFSQQAYGTSCTGPLSNQNAPLLVARGSTTYTQSFAEVQPVPKISTSQGDWFAPPHQAVPPSPPADQYATPVSPEKTGYAPHDPRSAGMDFVSSQCVVSSNQGVPNWSLMENSTSHQALQPPTPSPNLPQVAHLEDYSKEAVPNQSPGLQLCIPTLYPQPKLDSKDEIVDESLKSAIGAYFPPCSEHFFNVPDTNGNLKLYKAFSQIVITDIPFHVVKTVSSIVQPIPYQPEIVPISDLHHYPAVGALCTPSIGQPAELVVVPRTTSLFRHVQDDDFERLPPPPLPPVIASLPLWAIPRVTGAVMPVAVPPEQPSDASLITTSLNKGPGTSIYIFVMAPQKMTGTVKKETLRSRNHRERVKAKLDSVDKLKKELKDETEEKERLNIAKNVLMEQISVKEEQLRRCFLEISSLKMENKVLKEEISALKQQHSSATVHQPLRRGEEFSPTVFAGDQSPHSGDEGFGDCGRTSDSLSPCSVKNHDDFGFAQPIEPLQRIEWALNSVAQVRNEISIQQQPEEVCEMPTSRNMCDVAFGKVNMAAPIHIDLQQVALLFPEQQVIQIAFTDENNVQRHFVARTTIAMDEQDFVVLNRSAPSF
ncbi:hypothetical protein QR680_013708 [Steinernema hermaphroditum]|uniref:BZIP domain-containing protein n=1 Tax=Steinernema hermaphroditum TaxID=289476 RepID=A0AA39I8H9_9BILA|nr:hypothetical protein QR680_013708 [Steinernema hermaphroditum]